MAQKPRVPPLVTEIVVGGVWIASAIKVGGYTWESVSRTWSALPPPGSGSQAVAPPKAAVAAAKAIGLPKLAQNVPGVAASPVVNPLQKTDQGVAQTIVNGAKSVGKAIGNLLP